MSSKWQQQQPPPPTPLGARVVSYTLGAYKVFDR